MKKKWYDTIYLGDNATIMRDFADNSIDLTVTSPPYDGSRKYQGQHDFNFDELVHQLFRVTKDGGIVVWVVGDATVDGSETGTSFKQGMGFREGGFKLHDTMIYVKYASVPLTHRRYEQCWEYMFVFSKLVDKDTINTFNPIMLPNKTAGVINTSTRIHHGAGMEVGAVGSALKPYTRGELKIRPNLWIYKTGYSQSSNDRRAYEHPAIFPDKLAEDHILSWSNPGDIVLDPFCGSGTTCVMAKKNKRHYVGIDNVEDYVLLSLTRCK